MLTTSTRFASSGSGNDGRARSHLPAGSVSDSDFDGVAAAQVFSLLTPDTGLPRILFSVYFFVLLLNTWAAGPDRIRVLRSLAVTFGAAFILKFVVLDALSEPAGGRFARAIQLLFEGVTLGTLTQEVHHPASGYLAFFTIVLFLIVLAILSVRVPSSERAIVVRD
jgi:hypothetical protein